MDYLVTPPDATDWRLEPDEFERLLRERWPEAEVERKAESNPIYALDFRVDLDGEAVDGGFGRDGQMLGLEHDVWACATVATWFREQVDPAQPLLFYDAMFNKHVELTPGLSGEEVARRYLAG